MMNNVMYLELWTEYFVSSSKSLVLRASALENSNATLFYHSKKSLYHYIIPFYNTSNIPKLYFY